MYTELEIKKEMLEALQTVKAEIEYSFEMDTKMDLETILKIVDSAINKAI
jgi:hypothetical protein|tara:strand:+ start:792 stop:941 length:150 start_codon:yes stop_codon:yes gene_type:complete